MTYTLRHLKDMKLKDGNGLPFVTSAEIGTKPGTPSSDDLFPLVFIKSLLKILVVLFVILMSFFTLYRLRDRFLLCGSE